ncbi:MAG: UDP-glucose 4-epimerase GalE [Parachlamydiales bacterium]
MTLKEAVLVTGGAGYIGSQNCKSLFKNNFIPITYDNLSEGNEYAVKWGPLVKADLSDKKSLRNTLKKYKPKAVMHFAANALVGESVHNPKKYYENNLIGSLNLLEAMLENDIKHLIFSSSCATYGHPQSTPIKEEHPQNPISPYGKSKLMVEQILKDYSQAYGLNYISLRYFNASGADLDNDIGEDRRVETHLIPLAIDTALGKYEKLNVYGTDFKTRDGTAIRDYVHIEDIADAHLKALKLLLKENRSLQINIGSEMGFSVFEIIAEIEKQMGKKINIQLCDRRDGDPATLFADASFAKKILNWDPVHSNLHTIIKSALKWHQKKKDLKNLK